MATSQNGYQGITDPDSHLLHRWQVPGIDRYFLLRRGAVGFVLVWVALWYHEKIQKLNIKGQPWDEWAWAWRDIRNAIGRLSNHASGTAIDLNSWLYPLGTTLMKAWRVAKIKLLMARFNGKVRWGGFYEGRKDQMHFEINARLPKIERLARRLMKTKRGKRILAANPGQKRVILS